MLGQWIVFVPNDYDDGGVPDPNQSLSIVNHIQPPMDSTTYKGASLSSQYQAYIYAEYADSLHILILFSLLAVLQ